MRKNGVLGLYRGYSAYLIFAVPKSYMRFGTYTFFHNNIFTEKKKSHFFLSGLFAGFTEAVTVVTP